MAAAAQGAHRRVPVDPNQPPWNAVAKVQTNIGTKCSGVLIAPATVLTAAHCLYNRRTQALLQPVSLHVLFGYERGEYRWHRLVRSIAVGAGFDGRGGTPSADWARLELAEAVTPAPLQLTDIAPASGMPIALAGYNQDRSQLLMADPECHVRRVSQWPPTDQAIFLYHDCAGTLGTSGGPLLAKQGEEWVLVGIAIAAGKGYNIGLLPPLEALRSAPQ